MLLKVLTEINKNGIVIDYYRLTPGEITSTRKKDIGSAIIRHLSDKLDHKDDLDGITLFIYEKELKSLSLEIINVIIELLEEGIITENETLHGKKYYQLLSADSIKVSEFFKEK